MTEKNTEPQTFSERLIAAMADMENPTKAKKATVPTKNGGQYSYNYETLDQVLAVVRPALTKHGLALTQQQAWSENTSSYVLRTIVFDAKEERLMDERPLRDCPDAQQAGSWETYMRRYALRTAFGLTGEDDDGAATVGRSAAAYGSSGTQTRKQSNQPNHGREVAPDAQSKPAKSEAEQKAEYIDRINQRRGEAEALGIKAEGIDSYIAATFDGKTVEDLTIPELTKLGKHIATLISDKEGMNNG